MSLPRVLVTAGPTREYFDEVRFLSNASSGRMGIEIAAAAARRGWPVHLLLGPGTLAPPPEVLCTRFTSADDLEQLTRAAWPLTDAFVASAAVSDYRPAQRFAGKMKKTQQPIQPLLVPNPDILFNRSRDKRGRVLVGFALEAGPLEEEARRKLVQKNLDLIIANGAANLGADAGDFEWIESGGAARSLPATSKRDLAEAIMDFIARSWDVRTPG